MNEWIQNEFEYIQLKQKIKEYTFNTEKNICIIQFWCFIIHDKYRMLKIKSVLIKFDYLIESSKSTFDEENFTSHFSNLFSHVE